MTEKVLKGQELLNSVGKAYEKTDIPVFGPGDNVKVNVKIIEGQKSRIQVYEGLVIKRTGSGISESFTVRKMSYGVGVERTFPVHSPIIDSIEVVRRGKVRRAKLHYIRTLSAKKARIKELRVDQPKQEVAKTAKPKKEVKKAEHKAEPVKKAEPNKAEVKKDKK